MSDCASGDDCHCKGGDEKTKKKDGKGFDRRDVLRIGLATAASGAAVAGVSLHAGESVWQIDPEKCTWCGKCATDCVLAPSAVRCLHAYERCGYCELCFGFFEPKAIQLDEGAENQLCPTGALERVFIEEPYFEYIINEDLCIGCGKCVKGCASFGNGSLHLQIRHNLCNNCNECSIARVCPSNAISRVPEDEPYLIKGDFIPEEEG